MAVQKQGGFPGVGVHGSTPHRAPVCNTCRKRKEGQIYSRTPNGEFVCEDCSSPFQKDLLKGSCDSEFCACGRVEDGS